MDGWGTARWWLKGVLIQLRMEGEESPHGGRTGTREWDELVCPRCSTGNPHGAHTCKTCRSPLIIGGQIKRSIEGRLGGLASRAVGVESPSDEREFPAQLPIEELKRIPLFAELPGKSLSKVLPAPEELSFPKGSRIVKQGDIGDSYFIIRDGKVSVVLELSDSADIPVAQLGPGEGFGEMSLLTGESRSASVLAATDLKAWRLPKAGFEELLSDNLSLGVQFSRILAHRLKVLQEKIVS